MENGKWKMENGKFSETDDLGLSGVGCGRNSR
jgi:hypothetical protein